MHAVARYPVRGAVVLRYSPALWLAAAVPGLVATLVALAVLPAWGLARWWALAIPVVQAMVLAWDVPRATLALVDQALAREIETRERARAV